MTGALAFVSMPGLAAVAIGVALVGLGGLVLLVGLVLLAIAAVRRSLRPAGAGIAAAGLVLALAGAGLVVLGEEAQSGAADAASLVLAPVAIAAAILAGRYLARAVGPRRPEGAEGGPPP